MLEILLVVGISVHFQMQSNSLTLVTGTGGARVKSSAHIL